MADETLRLTVNGRGHNLHIDPRTPLLLALREDLDLRGVRAGCAIGECGSCTVLVAGDPTKSCLLPVVDVGNREVVTPEGLSGSAGVHPVQQAFLDVQAGQCGYCINGMIMSIAALGRRGASTEEELRAGLDEHLCRCATHPRILRAGRAVLGIDDHSEPVEVRQTQVHEAVPAARASALDRYPDVASWLRATQDGRVEILTGKVELGQGIRTALEQVVAAHLGLDADLVAARPTSTATSVDEGYTAGSNSLDGGGAALASAAVAFRRLCLERCAARWACSAAELELSPAGEISGPDGAALTLRELAAGDPITGTIEVEDRPDWADAALGRARLRVDLVDKLTGEPAYVQDLAIPGQLHVRALLPPSYDAVLRDVDRSAVEAMPGVVRVVVDGRLLLVIAEREDQAVRGLARLARDTTWDERAEQAAAQAPASFRALPVEAYVVRDDEIPPTEDGHRHRATYSQPYQMHAAIAPSCAIAVAEEGRTKVWSHTQGVFPLQRELATVFEVEPEHFEIEHRDGPGCYGQNLADDAAACAVVAARAVPGRPVRFQFSVDDEFSWDPYGSAMLTDLEASWDDQGRITAWRHEGRTDVHSTRPHGSGDSLIVSWLMADGPGRGWPGPTEGGARNAVPGYDIPLVAARAEHVRGPLRVGALRSLGSFQNVFAIESFVDELAELVGKDPVAFRLEHLSDPRSCAVIEAAAERLGWDPRVGPSGRGKGIAFARYKEVKAYVAQAVEVRVDPTDGTIEPVRIVIACDAGTVVNLDGLVNQLEGGALQGLSRALWEEVRVGSRGIVSRDWTSYPVLRFPEVPVVETIILEGKGQPPLGAGEAATPSIAPAVANAIDDAVGIRLRDLPLTPRRLEQRLLTMAEDEASRVLIR